MLSEGIRLRHCANRRLGHYGLGSHLINGKTREVSTQQTLVQRSYDTLVLHECSIFRQVLRNSKVRPPDRVLDYDVLR